MTVRHECNYADSQIQPWNLDGVGRSAAIASVITAWICAAAQGSRVVKINDRASAVAWARSEAHRIANGDYDREPLGVFRVAQRMEHVLTRWQWLDDAFPPAIADLVFGWNVSGEETDVAIREAARELARDGSDNGPPLPPRDELG